MLYFMYFFALCGLLAPSQGSDNSDNPMAVVNVCCGEITKILADALGGKLERLLKPAENEGGSGALLPLGNLLGTATNLLQLKNSKLVQVRASCTPKAIRLALQLCIDLTFLSELLAKLPLITDANEITVEATVNVNIPLLLDEKKGLRLEFFQETCNALKISLQVKGLDNLGALSQLTKALKDPLAKLITPGLCKGLSGAVGVLNKKLKTVGGILPTDAAKATNDYIMKSIRKGRNGCLIIDLNASDENGPVAGSDVPITMPKMRRNGVSISTPLIESCFNDQIPKEKINNMLEQSNCRMEFEGLTCTTTPAGKTLHGMDWQMEVTGSPKISMQYGGKTIVKVPIAVKAQDPDSKETVYSSSTKIRLTATMSHEDGFLTFTCVSYSIDPTMPDSSCSCQVDNAELKMAMEKCAGEVAEEIMANPVQIALPESLASSDDQEVKVMDGCVVVQSKEDPWKSTDGEATCGPPEMSQPPAESKEHGSPILDVLNG